MTSETPIQAHCAPIQLRPTVPCTRTASAVQHHRNELLAWTRTAGACNVPMRGVSKVG